MHFSQNVIFGVPGQNISITAGPNCMIFSELTDMNKMCALNNLDFHLKTEFFFSNLKYKKVHLLLRKCDHAPHDQEKFIRKTIQNTLQLSLDIIAQNMKHSLSLCPYFLASETALSYI